LRLFHVAAVIRSLLSTTACFYKWQHRPVV